MVLKRDVLPKNPELEKKGERENIGFVSTTYVVRLSHYCEYLIVLERLLKKERRQRTRKRIQGYD